jgi:hypothetical protein
MAEYGRDITESEAHDYVERCKLYKDSLIDGILGPHLNGPPGDVKNSAMYYSARTNAWIFDAALVKDIFEDPDAKYFAVFLGATIDMDSIVVLTGLKEKSATEPTKLLAAAKKIEQPALFDHAKFPNSANGPIDLPA